MKFLFLGFIVFIKLSYSANSCLHDKGLVRVDISASEILAEYNNPCDESIKHYKSPLLGYVTPWNPEGKNIAKRFATKFDIIAPVWYNIDLLNGRYRITDEDNYDEAFLAELKEKNPSIKIVPRFNMQNSALGRYYQLSSSTEARALASKIVDYAQY